MKILIAAVAALLVISCNSNPDFLKEKAKTENVLLKDEEKPSVADIPAGNESINADTVASPQEPQKQNQTQKNLPAPRID